jgi:hypothetical protein
MNLTQRVKSLSIISVVVAASALASRAQQLACGGPWSGPYTPGSNNCVTAVGSTAEETLAYARGELFPAHLFGIAGVWCAYCPTDLQCQGETELRPGSVSIVATFDVSTGQHFVTMCINGNYKLRCLDC